MVSVTVAGKQDGNPVAFAPETPPPAAVTFQRFKVKRHGLRPLIFDGALLVEHASRADTGALQTVRIWETGGPFVLQIAISQGEADEDGWDSSHVSVCDDAEAVRAQMDQFDPSSTLTEQMGALLRCDTRDLETTTQAYAAALTAVDANSNALAQAFET